MAIEKSSMESLVVMNYSFWKDKRVFITGHTGFKGSWLSIWLNQLGAKVVGFALPPTSTPNLFTLAKIDQMVTSIEGDIRNRELLLNSIKKAEPDIVLHLAAQPLVRESYINPVETYEINVLGTVNLLEAIRQVKSIKAVVNVTTDKVYENKEWEWGYRENEPFGGYDPYSNSKACSELVTLAYRSSFFNPDDYSKHGVALASARAGNVIGGGDWAVDRIVPDSIKALSNGEPIRIRNPHSIRPWQHVLEPLSGYMLLAEFLFDKGVKYAEGWNFGPEERDCVAVEVLVQKLCNLWGQDAKYQVTGNNGPHEANFLKLDCSKAKARLQWCPHWDLHATLESIVIWSQKYLAGKDLRDVCVEQIIKWKNS